MLCAYCHGKRLVVRDGQPFPCEACGGLGVAHCCEGMMAQPGETDDARMAPRGDARPAQKGESGGNP